VNENAGNHAAVNGLDLYYEVHGDGEPLILLHGGVIVVDLQARGSTAAIDRPTL